MYVFIRFSGGQLTIHHKTFLPDSPEKGMALDQEERNGNADQSLLHC